MQRRPHARSAFRRCQTGNAKPCRTEVPVPTAIGVADREAPSRASIPSSRRLVAIATISSQRRACCCCAYKDKPA